MWLRPMLREENNFDFNNFEFSFPLGNYGSPRCATMARTCRGVKLLLSGL